MYFLPLPSQPRRPALKRKCAIESQTWWLRNVSSPIPPDSQKHSQRSFSLSPSLPSINSSQVWTRASFSSPELESKGSWVQQQCCFPVAHSLVGDTLVTRHRTKLNGLSAQSLSRVWLCAAPWTIAQQAPLSMDFPRQEYWSGLLFPSPGDLPQPGIKLASPALAGGFFYH